MMTGQVISFGSQLDVVQASLEAIGYVTGLGYDRVKADFGEVSPSRGITMALVCEYLSTQGFATQPISLHDPFSQKPREHWPPYPWAPVHLASVEREHGLGKRYVAVLGDGKVLDAEWGGDRMLGDYERVIQVVGIYRVGAAS